MCCTIFVRHQTKIDETGISEIKPPNASVISMKGEEKMNEPVVDEIRRQYGDRVKIEVVDKAQDLYKIAAIKPQSPVRKMGRYLLYFVNAAGKIAAIYAVLITLFPEHVERPMVYVYKTEELMKKHHQDHEIPGYEPKVRDPYWDDNAYLANVSSSVITVPDGQFINDTTFVPLCTSGIPPKMVIRTYGDT